MADMLELIARLEAAEAGSLELDAAVCDALNWRRTDGFWTFPAKVTFSLDAALALAERVLPGAEWRGGTGDGSRTRPWARVGPWIDPDATGANVALATCIAVLKAVHTASPIPHGYEAAGEVSPNLKAKAQGEGG